MRRFGMHPSFMMVDVVYISGGISTPWRRVGSIASCLALPVDFGSA
ncbi:MAG: hypothetical protein J0I84_15340 [Terrimonas sp.]|nr:hypothetical protein [Terrimonas sp.]